MWLCAFHTPSGHEKILVYLEYKTHTEADFQSSALQAPHGMLGNIYAMPPREATTLASMEMGMVWTWYQKPYFQQICCVDERSLWVSLRCALKVTEPQSLGISWNNGRRKRTASVEMPVVYIGVGIICWYACININRARKKVREALSESVLVET